MRHAERGNGMVEFAIAATALLLFIFGILEFSRAMYVYHTVSNAARLGSRWAIVRGSNCTVLDSCQATQDQIQSYVRSQVVAIMDPSLVTVTASWPGTNNTCPAGGASNARGCLVIVTVSYPFRFIVPLVGATATPLTLTSSSQMVIAN